MSRNMYQIYRQVLFASHKMANRATPAYISNQQSVAEHFNRIQNSTKMLSRNFSVRPSPLCAANAGQQHVAKKENIITPLLTFKREISHTVGTEVHRSGLIPKPIIPVDDIGNVDPPGYVKGEKEIRCKLASLYRLVDHFGWSQAVFNHITVRVSEDEHHFLLNPFGLLYHEVTASSLIKVDVQGNMIDSGSTYFGVNIPGFVLHSAVHSARPDAKCVIHIHHPACIAVASMKCGFLPVSQESVLIGNVSYHDFYGVLVDKAEREVIVKNLGNNHIMLLRNHGMVAIGTSVEEAFTRAYHMVLACEAQVTMMSAGLENLILISEEAKQRSMEVVRRAQQLIEEGALKGKSGQASGASAKKAQPIWKLGDLEFEAYMRMMDSAGYRTSYPYRLPSVKKPSADSNAL